MKTSHPLNRSCRRLFALFLLLAALLTGAQVIAQQSPSPVDQPTPAPENAYTEKQFDADWAKLKIDKEKMELMMGRVMPFVGMGFTILILIIVFGTQRRADRNRHETIRKYLELGIEVPELLLIDPANPQHKKPMSDKRKGIIWFSVGIGIAATVYILTGNQKYMATAIIPLFIGVGYLISAFVVPEKSEEK